MILAIERDLARGPASQAILKCDNWRSTSGSMLTEPGPRNNPRRGDPCVFSDEQAVGGIVHRGGRVREHDQRALIGAIEDDLAGEPASEAVLKK
jgi:hypothetical protein